MDGSVCKKSSKGKKDDLYHVIHKVPYGDSPYVKAKHAQLVDKDPEAAIVLFWKAINAGDKVDSALKDMAVVMKQLDRAEEAIEAIRSFRVLCSKQSQESLDNVLLDLYKGNLGWAYMQKTNYMMAEVVFKKAQMIDADANKACNLVLCLMRQSRYEEALLVLEEVLQGKLPGSDEIKSKKRAEELLEELNANMPQPQFMDTLGLDDDFVKGIDELLNAWGTNRSRRLPIFVEISSVRDQLAC
ncbi:protein SULFUR DEFICIENCY-INDUCED 1-like isoform X2 [Gastrolobium bilobum]|uniref:protein SULFUR DEFICIENCY-INDUCED 1-like isoform X2 n=1 Tax=Gastrolobium bilobum TaxID=150636 RepID=UPI002AB2A5EA|nr:protein SULFUR DEFICIENCY-INDUCED 1-like isoform X2 [Gastrolobium bilobum]